MKIQSAKIIRPIVTGFALLLLDFLTKYIVNLKLPFEKVQQTFLPFLLLYRTHNTGYHFLFGPIENHFIWAMAGLIFVILLIASLVHTLMKEEFDHFNFTIYAVILSLTIGASGNVLEILIYGRATDFFIFKPFPWPSNLCDQYINAILYITLPIIIIRAMIDRKRQKKNLSVTDQSNSSEASSAPTGVSGETGHLKDRDD